MRHDLILPDDIDAAEDVLENLCEIHANKHSPHYEYPQELAVSDYGDYYGFEAYGLAKKLLVAEMVLMKTKFSGKTRKRVISIGYDPSTTIDARNGKRYTGALVIYVWKLQVHLSRVTDVVREQVGNGDGDGDGDGGGGGDNRNAKRPRIEALAQPIQAVQPVEYQTFDQPQRTLDPASVPVLLVPTLASASASDRESDSSSPSSSSNRFGVFGRAITRAFSLRSQTN